MSTYRAFEAALRHPTRRWPKRLLVAALLLMGMGGFVGYRVITNQTGIQDVNNSPIVTNIPKRTGQTQTLNEKLFSLEVPGAWKEIFRDDDKGTLVIEWQSQEPNRDARFLTVYVDTVPQDFGFNRLLPVKATANTLTAGLLSDNCLSFTNKDDVATGSGYRKATWQNVSFLCDVARTERNLLGTGSSEEGLSTSVRGDKGGMHKYFFTYADNTSQVDLARFSEIIETFTAK